MQPHAIDVHSHFFPKPSLVLIAHEDFDIDLRVSAMTRAGVQVHALSLTAPMVTLRDNAARLLGLR